ncbi:MAG: hypothetical protein CMF12_03620 [Idiomarina sp.]|uniref:hypothetical protein n=1 Tax=Idiomarina sp. TaxID=1874361 RepID=UPI000C626121|nr:hypothetical protein [Idiomarina sp.]MBT41594.1 hypothetical protein [Idiomarina sp.]
MKKNIKVTVEQNRTLTGVGFVVVLMDERSKILTVHGFVVVRMGAQSKTPMVLGYAPDLTGQYNAHDFRHLSCFLYAKSAPTTSTRDGDIMSPIN